MTYDCGKQRLQFVRSIELAMLFLTCSFCPFSGALVFCMQAGFAMLCAGAVRRKNTRNTMLKNLLDAAGAAVAFYCVGFAFAFGGDDLSTTGTTFIGLSNFFGRGDIDMPFYFFQYTFFAATGGYRNANRPTAAFPGF